MVSFFQKRKNKQTKNCLSSLLYRFNRMKCCGKHDCFQFSFFCCCLLSLPIPFTYLFILFYFFRLFYFSISNLRMKIMWLVSVTKLSFNWLPDLNGAILTNIYIYKDIHSAKIKKKTHDRRVRMRKRDLAKRNLGQECSIGWSGKNIQPIYFHSILCLCVYKMSCTSRQHFSDMLFVFFSFR